MRNIVLLFALWCSGCQALASRDVAAGCQVADVASTAYALHHNPNASEQNSVFPVNLLYVIKLALAAYIKWGNNGWEEAPVGVRAFVSVVGCGPAINNVMVGRQR
jgi:hypothetical protein